jgi:hypothetical protein
MYFTCAHLVADEAIAAIAAAWRSGRDRLNA